MATASLAAAPRTDTGKGAARKLRANKQIPAVIYGHHREPRSLTIDGKELERLLSHVAAGTTVVELSLDGATARTLIREIQRHPFKKMFLHVDFQELVAGEKITVAVPLVIVGTAPGIREGGVLNQVMNQIEIEVDPASIPNHIDVDVSALALNDSVHVRDLKVPEGSTVLEDEDATVCVLSPPRVEQSATPAVEAADTSSEPELIRKAKEDDEA